MSLLGIVTILAAGGNVVSLGLAGPTLELFAYLLTYNHRSLRRDYLADLIWEDLESARSRAALNTALWRVRRAVAALPGMTLESDSAKVRISIDATVRLDTLRLRLVMDQAVAAFDAKAGLPTEIRVELADMLGRCDGDFLDGCNSSWVLVVREEYFNLRLRGLALLMQDAGIRSVYEDALSFGRRILAVDPFREAVQCEMLWLYMLSGRRAVAIRHYRDYAEMLRRELGITPMAETRAVYDAICADANQEKALFNSGAPPAPVVLLGAIERDRRSFYRAHFVPGA
ncbi:MAG: BTAD domain-containing putative transcriptional regulator [Devosia sp.]